MTTVLNILKNDMTHENLTFSEPFYDVNGDLISVSHIISVFTIVANLELKS